jgi:uncharacterized protein (PEP-CTERM system associated)
MNRGSRGVLRCRRQLGAAFLTACCVAATEARADVVIDGNWQYGPDYNHDDVPGGILGFRPRIDLSEVYVDNIDLTGPRQPKTDAFITEVRPGFRYEAARPRFQALVDYQFQYLLNTSESGRNQSYQQLSADATGTVIPDLFFVRADAGAAQVVANATRPSTLDTVVNGTGNLVNGYTGSVSPYLQRHFGDTVARLEYSRGFVSYRGTKDGGFAKSNIPGSQNRRILATCGSDEERLTRFSWKTSFEREEATYGAVVPAFRYEQALLTLGYAVTLQLRLLGEGGAESNLANGSTAGDLNTGYYQGGFAYSLGRANEIRVLAGHRFYGTSYDFLYRYVGRMLGVESTYTEGPTTAAQELFIRPLSGGSATVVTPVIIGGDLAALTNEVFVKKYSDNRISLKGRRTEIDLSLSIYRRKYLSDVAKNDRSTQIAAAVIRTLNSRDRLRLTYALRRYNITQVGGLNESGLRLEWVRQISRTFVASGSVGELRGTGNTARYTANYAMISVGKAF